MRSARKELADLSRSFALFFYPIDDVCRMSDEEVLSALPPNAFRALLLVPCTPDQIKEAAREKIREINELN